MFKRVEVSGFRLMPLTTVQGSEVSNCTLQVACT